MQSGNKIISCTSQYRSIILPEKMIVRQTTSCKKCLLCLISSQTSFSVSQDGPTHREVLSTSSPQTLLRFCQKGFWSCIHGTLFPGRSAFCQLSLKSWGFPPSHFHLSTCLIFIILSCFFIGLCGLEGLYLNVVEDYILHSISTSPCCLWITSQ